MSEAPIDDPLQSQRPLPLSEPAVAAKGDAVPEAEDAPASLAGTGDVNEASLFFGISSERLRRRARWAGTFLLLSGLLPHEFVDTSPLFLWDTLPELSLAAALAAIAMPLAGLAILVASFVTRRATSLGVVTLSSLALVSVLYQLGGDRAAWDVFSMPESISNRPAPVLLALALTAAGAALAFRPKTRRLSQILLGCGVSSAVFFYVWPTRGEAPMATLYRAFASLPDLPSVRFQIGMLLLASILLWPLFATLLGLIYLKKTPKRDDPWVSVLATFGLPALLLMFAYRALLFAQAGLAFLAYVFTILVVTGILAILSSAIVVVGEAMSLSPGELASADEEEPASKGQASSGARGPAKKSKRRGLSLRVAAIVGAVVVATLSVSEWVLARPPKKGVEWQLSGATEDADKVFGPLFSNWDRARRAWDSEVRHEASASARIEVKRAAKDLGEASKKLDPRLAEAFLALTTESEDLDLAGRRFLRLIEQVNEASQQARLPYYVDPTLYVEETKDGVHRGYYASAFRIDSVNRWDVDGQAFATLMVKPVSSGRGGHGLLGFSRDVQPFALVDVEEIEPFRADLETSARSKMCSARTFPIGRAERPFETCGEVLARLVEEAGGGVKDALVVGTERHELQHQIDGPHLAMSSAVLKRLGAYVPSFQDRVNRELSAYVAELTAEGMAPRFELIHLAQFVLGGQTGAYHHAAVLFFEALSQKELRHGVEPRGEVDFADFDEVLTTLAALTDAELRTKGRAAHKKLFGAELADPKRVH